MRFPSLSVSIESQLMRLLMLRLFIERFVVMLTEPLILNHPWGRFSIDCPYLNLIKSERERLPPMYKLPDFETFIFNPVISTAEFVLMPSLTLDLKE